MVLSLVKYYLNLIEKETRQSFEIVSLKREPGGLIDLEKG